MGFGVPCPGHVQGFVEGVVGVEVDLKGGLMALCVLILEVVGGAGRRHVQHCDLTLRE